MSDKNSSFINLPDLPDSIDNAVKNLTDKPTQGIGQTFSDVWYLVFGGITHAADKRRMKYAHDLELYSQELSQAISSIPEENLIEPNFQTTAQALENSKYCIESEELRKLFVNLISKSMNNNYISNVHPSFAEIIKQMSPIDAKILKTLHPDRIFPLVNYVLENRQTLGSEIKLSTVYISSLPDIDLKTASFAISSLERLGIIAIDTGPFCTDESVYIPYKKTAFYKEFSSEAIRLYASKRASIQKYLGYFTPLGKYFFEVCVK